jgi:hypothetical protein
MRSAKRKGSSGGAGVRSTAVGTGSDGAYGPADADDAADRDKETGPQRTVSSRAPPTASSAPVATNTSAHTHRRHRRRPVPTLTPAPAPIPRPTPASTPSIGLITAVAAAAAAAALGGGGGGGAIVRAVWSARLRAAAAAARAEARGAGGGGGGGSGRGRGRGAVRGRRPLRPTAAAAHGGGGGRSNGRCGPGPFAAITHRKHGGRRDEPVDDHDTNNTMMTCKRPPPARFSRAAGPDGTRDRYSYTLDGRRPAAPPVPPISIVGRVVNVACQCLAPEQPFFGETQPDGADKNIVRPPSAS